MRCLTVGELKKQLDMNPDDMPVVYASDEEGNSYHPVLCMPSPVEFDDVKPLMYTHEIGCFNGQKMVLVIN